VSVPVLKSRPGFRMLACKIVQTLTRDDMHTKRCLDCAENTTALP
jgi:hypothetical protein